jgi:hypothetical protein
MQLETKLRVGHRGERLSGYPPEHQIRIVGLLEPLPATPYHVAVPALVAPWRLVVRRESRRGSRQLRLGAHDQGRAMRRSVCVSGW